MFVCHNLVFLSQYILEMLEGKRKFLVFAHHKIVLDKICELLDEKVYIIIAIVDRLILWCYIIYSEA